jgi:hypothetical protein
MNAAFAGRWWLTTVILTIQEAAIRRIVAWSCCGKNVGPVRTRLKHRWLEERKIYYASRPAPWISPKMAPAPQLKAAGFLCLRMQKQASGKDKSRYSSFGGVI